MLHKKSFFLLIFFVVVSAYSYDRFISLKIGPCWPSALRFSEISTAGDGSASMGWAFEENLYLGGTINFLWNVNKKSTLLSGNTYRIEESEKSFMFPVSGQIGLAPIPDYMFYPYISTNIGLGMMYYSNKKDSTRVSDEDRLSISDENGFYMGFYWKIAADCIYKLGEQVRLFLGIDYQLCNTTKMNQQHGDIFTRRDMSAFGLRAGILLIY
ncbi:MAG: hypothetical protein N2053_01785 [Chitinispirillaceae bacterium]|nr:hypothetical protein [Chitinispirillaceae bacterium]